MSRSDSSTFVLTLKLNTTKRDDEALEKRFSAGQKMYNCLVRHARKAVCNLLADKGYHTLLEERLTADAVRMRQINKGLSDIRKSYCLSEYQFHAWIAVQQHRYKHYIDSLTAQKIATSVWRAVEKYVFGDGKKLHFRKSEDFTSLEGKNNLSGIKFRSGRVEWRGLFIQAQIRKDDSYARESLSRKVKYCRIMRKPIGTRYHYYVQLILEGIPPKKHEFLDEGRVGIDPGTSSEAVVSGRGCILTEIAPDRKKISRKAARIQRRIDRSRRATNPDNYNPDGTVVQHPHTFVKSQNYRKDQMRLASLRRQNAAYVRQEEEILANRVLCEHGSDIFTEQMNYKGLQHRAKTQTVSETTGRIRSKKRFGSSLASHAPARFLSILQRKLGYIGKTLNKVNTVTYRASQYNHETLLYEKQPLNNRSK